ncbi:MAG: translation initiation factor IF-2 subunit alpha [Candidatus Helarchaeota archaeon]
MKSLFINEIREIGEYVIGSISRVESHGAYAVLDEYNNNEGMIHISEVASSWVRNIRNFVREGQKIVAKVLNVNPNKGHIDLSLRRVSQAIKKQKIKQWKRSQKAENLLNLCVKKHNEIHQTSKTLDDALNEVGWKLEDAFEDILAGFEEAKEKGKKVLVQKGVPADWVDIITEIAKVYVEIPQVKVIGTIEIQCHASDGVLQIQKALKSGIDAVKGNGIKVNINLIGSPKYRLELIAQNKRKAEAAINKVTKSITSSIVKSGGQAKFHIRS